MSGLGPRALAALWAGKLTKLFLKLMGRGGTTLPGRVARGVCPRLPACLAAGVDITAVSGTNGKTTTSRMIESACEGAGIDSFSNHSGANLITGITTVLMDNADWLGRPRKTHGVIECDELTGRLAFPLLRPRRIVITNLYRDQLDRCGEITHVQNALRAGIGGAPEAELCLNADDPLICALAGELPNAVHWFSVEGDFPGEGEGPNDARYCERCGAPYAYERRSFAHLGAWYCPECGAAHPRAELLAELRQEGEESSEITLRWEGESYPLTLPLPGSYHVYNAAAAATALRSLGFTGTETAVALEHSSAAFGRGESFPLGGGVQMMLIKNPAGCDRVLHHLSTYAEPFTLAVLLNDETADGTDISWIWDADFERLGSLGMLQEILVGGKRGEELLLRMKYAGMDPRRVRLVHDLMELVSALREREEKCVVMPTYTAMMALRPLLVKETGGREFWEQ